MNSFESWGRVPRLQQSEAVIPWIEPKSVIEHFKSSKSSSLPVGMGRSYGDSCLAPKDGQIISVLGHSRILSFDQNTGVIRCQSGITFDDLLNFCIPKKWFLPVSPGTKYITLGGAVANDVHGKNHHKRGNFGHWVKSLQLIRSNGEVITCSQNNNSDYFKATVGGLGLTGIIDWVEFQLIPIDSSYLDVEIIPFSNVEKYFDLSEASQDFEYTVSWVDTQSEDTHLGRGLYIRGNHSKKSAGLDLHRQKFGFPLEMPEFLVNSLTSKVFNSVYYRKTFLKPKELLQHYDPFFYPLDAIRSWNKVYGKRGFYQYQCVLPPSHARKGTIQLLEMVSRSGLSSPLTVLKDFGDLPSLGFLSFPRAGTTLALDIPNTGSESLNLMQKMDDVVLGSGGAIYPAKDARMSKEMFKKSFPQLDTFLKFKDPKLTSHFFERVT